MENLYKFYESSRHEPELIALVSHTYERSQIWHEQLKHLNFRSLQVLATYNMVVGLSKVFPPKGVCKGCVLAKHHQAPFDYGKSRRKQNLLELVHNDVYCINLPSLVGARYILTFIDDFSRFRWVFLLKNNNLVFEKFKEFRAFAEKKCGRPIKCLRSNNGGEYVNRPFKEYLL